MRYSQVALSYLSFDILLFEIEKAYSIHFKLNEHKNGID